LSAGGFGSVVVEIMNAREVDFRDLFLNAAVISAALRGLCGSSISTRGIAVVKRRERRGF